MNGKDTLYREDDEGAGSFRFDERVADVFPDMIRRSVPGYELIVPMIGQLARRYAQDGTVIYDLGCSLGTVTLALGDALAGRPVRIVAVDASEAMARRCRAAVERRCPPVTTEVLRGDVRDLEIADASMVVLNFTLQFVDEAGRPGLLERIGAGLRPGGVLVLSEKIRFESDAEQQRQTGWHEDFKRMQGYTELEIARKRTALERVLRPESERVHVERLRKAGFRRVTRWFQCFAFCSYLAEK
jgi:tRNA (cmo5U34)-methyltransferase